MARILFYGGSGGYGVGGLEGGIGDRTKAEMVRRRHFDKRPSAEVTVLAQPGMTLPEMLPYITGNNEQFGMNRSTGERCLVVAAFLLGASESRERTRAHKTEPVVPLPTFEAALSKLGEICCTERITPVFIGFPPIDDARTHPFQPTGEVFDDARIQEYNAATAAHALSVGATYVDTRAVLGGGTGRAKAYLSDGLHLNDFGYELVYGTVLPAINEALTRRPTATLAAASA